MNSSLVFDDGSYQDLPYIELYGSAVRGQEEFIEGKNIFYQHLDEQADIKSRITALDFNSLLIEKQVEAEKLGYIDHPAKMWLYELTEVQSANIAGLKALNIALGSTDYLEHKVLEEEIQVNSALQEELQMKLTGIRGRADEVLHGEPWTRIGAGLWIVVNDENGNKYLVMSFRNPRKVAEMPSMLGYSSSGSIDVIDQTPAHGVLRELSEELGLQIPALDEITLFSIGIDTARYLIQLSYVWESPYTIDQVMRGKQNFAVSAGEQTTFFIPFTKETCTNFLKCAMEPSAAYSLMRLVQKNF